MSFHKKDAGDKTDTPLLQVQGVTVRCGGSIAFDGKTISRLPRHRMASIGIGRTFQNLALARQWVCETLDVDPMLAFYVEHLHAQAALHRPEVPRPAAALKELLSEREQEILRALANAISNKRIAQTLGASPETVKWHLKNVYGKLGVSGRDDAVARARDLGLVDLA